MIDILCLFVAEWMHHRGRIQVNTFVYSHLFIYSFILGRGFLQIDGKQMANKGNMFFLDVLDGRQMSFMTVGKSF